MKVEQIMTRNVSTCRANDSLETAARTMWDADCGFVPVLSAEGEVIGVITDRDVCMAAMFTRKPLAAIAVETAMSRDVCSCRPYDSLDLAGKLMRSRQVHRLPVTDGGGRPVGVLSLNDLVLEAERERSRERGAEVRREQVASTLAAICEHRPRSEIALRS